jgi:hypothetical protein
VTISRKGGKVISDSSQDAEFSASYFCHVDRLREVNCNITLIMLVIVIRPSNSGSQLPCQDEVGLV